MAEEGAEPQWGGEAKRCSSEWREEENERRKEKGTREEGREREKEKKKLKFLKCFPDYIARRDFTNKSSIIKT